MNINNHNISNNISNNNYSYSSDGRRTTTDDRRSTTPRPPMPESGRARVRHARSSAGRPGRALRLLRGAAVPPGRGARSWTHLGAEWCRDGLMRS